MEFPPRSSTPADGAAANGQRGEGRGAVAAETGAGAEFDLALVDARFPGDGVAGASDDQLTATVFVRPPVPPIILLVNGEECPNEPSTRMPAHSAIPVPVMPAVPVILAFPPVARMFPAVFVPRSGSEVSR